MFFQAVFFRFFSLNVLLCACMLVLWCWLLDPVYGFYDSFGAALMSGSITDTPITETYHLSLNPIAKFIGWLHSLFPALPWTGILIGLFLVIIQSLFITILQMLAGFDSWRITETAILWVVSTVFALGFSFIEFSGTGISILLSFMSVVGLWFVVENTQRISGRILLILLFGLTFLLSFSWRMEGCVGGAILAACWVLAVFRNWWTIFRVFTVPAVVAGVMFFSLYLQLRQHPFFREVEPLVFYVTDSRNPPPLRATDSTDLLLQSMARGSFLIDTTVFNHALFSRMAAQKSQAGIQAFAHPIKIFRQVKEVALPTILLNYRLTLVYLLLFIYLLYCARKAADASTHLRRVFIFNGAVWLVISATAYAMKMETWHYVPIVQCSSLGNMLLLAMMPYVRLQQKNSAFKMAVGIFCAMIFTALIWQLQSSKISLNQKIELRKAIFAEASDKLLFLDVTSREILDDYVFRMYRPIKNIVMYDMAQIPFLPQYECQLNDLCRCNSHVAREFFAFMKNNAARIDYLSTPYRVQHLSRFSHVFLQMPVHFVPRKMYVLNHVKYGADTIVCYTLAFQ